MLTDNYLKVVTAKRSYESISGSTYMSGKLTPLIGNFVDYTGTNRSAIWTYTTSNQSSQYLFYAGDLQGKLLSLNYNLTTANKDEFSNRYTLEDKMAVMVTYDSTNTAISTSDYDLKGVAIDKSYMAISTSGGVNTLTISNTTQTDMSFNRVGIYSFGLVAYETVRPCLLAEFALPTVTLAPGETKSFTFTFSNDTENS